MWRFSQDLLQLHLSCNPKDRRKMSQNEPEVGDEAEAAEMQKVVNAEDLFGERREIWIELDGVRYRLRITRRGKLILQK